MRHLASILWKLLIPLALPFHHTTGVSDQDTDKKKVHIISININLIEMQLKEIVKLENPHHMLKIQHPLLASHKFSIEHSRNVLVGVCVLPQTFYWHLQSSSPTESLPHQAGSSLGSSTLPLISKDSIVENMVWSRAAASPVLARHSSSLRISFCSIAKLYRGSKSWSQQKCNPPGEPLGEDCSHLTAVVGCRSRSTSLWLGLLNLQNVSCRDQDRAFPRNGPFTCAAPA